MFEYALRKKPLADKTDNANTGLSDGITYDVAIAGAGPAGAFLALKLVRQGFKVAVFETRAQTKRKVCGDYICPPGKNLLIEAGLSELVARARPIRFMKVVTSSGQEVDCPYPDSAQGIAISRLDLDKTLIEAAQKAGAKFYFGEAITDAKLVQKNNLDTSMVSITTQKQKLIVKLLVGADGRSSWVARHFALTKNIKSDRVALRAFFTSDYKNSESAELHLLNDHKYIGVDHLSDFETSVAIVLPKAELQKFSSLQECFIENLKSAKNLSARLKKHVAEIASENLTMHIESSSPLTHRVSSVFKHSVALIGDAAGYIDPITGEGNYMALVTATKLAQLLKAPATLDSAEALNFSLKLYSTWHKKTVQTKMLINLGFQSLIKHPSLVNIVASHLAKKESRRRAFIEVVGNVSTPFKMLPHILA